MFHSSTKECVQFLWQFFEERDTNYSVNIKIKRGIPNLSCTDGTCPKAVNLIDAARLGCPQCAKRFIGEAGRKGENGITALMLAARVGCLDIVKLLVDKESKMIDTRRKSALMYGVRSRNPDCIRVLLVEAGMQS